MHPNPRNLRSWAGAFLLALASAACTEDGQPLEPGDVAPRPISLIAAIQCGGTTGSGGTIVCENGAFAELIVGNVAVTGDTLAFDVSLRNRIAQPLGTPDGSTATGVWLFIHSGPVSPTGAVDFVNPDGLAAFTAGNQPYYEYSTIIAPNASSPSRRWKLAFVPGVDSIFFSVGFSGAVPFPRGWVDVEPGNVLLSVGGTRALTGTPRNFAGNPQPDIPITWSSSNPAVATVNASTGYVTAVAKGAATIQATTHNEGQIGTTTVRVCAIPELAVGGVATLAMPGDATFCLSGGASGAEYTVMPVNFTGGIASMTVTAAGIVPVTGAPSPTLLGGGGQPALSASRMAVLRAEDAFEQRLREREAARLTRLIPAASRAFRARAASPGARRSITPGVPAVGALMAVNVESSGSCEAPVVRDGRVKVVGTHVIVMADTTSPSGLLTTADYQEVADRFDTLIWPTLTANFGAPEDIDGNGRVIVFFTSAVNALTPAGSAPVTHGYTLRRDLFFTSSCAGSNEGEIIYLAVPDLAGMVNGNQRSIASVKAAAAPTLGHEMAHLINASRRLYVNFAPAFEDVLLDEGLAWVGEELLFYAASGKQQRQNLGFAAVTADAATRAAFLAYAEPNYARLRDWLRAPQALTGSSVWALLRYSADRKDRPEMFWYALVNSTSTGMANYAAVVGGPPDLWVRSFVVAMYTDDAVAGAVGPYAVRSWNFRSIYDALDYDGDRLADGYPLAVRNPADGVADLFTLAGGGGAAYLRMGVPAGGVASVTLQSNGAAPPSTLMVSVVRRK